MKKTKIIVPALGMLLLSTAASVTGTVAWFAVNTSVTVTGLQVKAKAEGGIVIAPYTITKTSVADPTGEAPNRINTKTDYDEVAPEANTFKNTATNDLGLAELYPTSTSTTTAWYHAVSNDVNNHAAASAQSYTTLTGITTDGKMLKGNGSESGQGLYAADSYFLYNKYKVKSTTSADNFDLYIRSITVTGASTSLALDSSLRIALKAGTGNAMFYAPLYDAAPDGGLKWYTGSAVEASTAKVGHEWNSENKISGGDAEVNNTGIDLQIWVYYEGEDTNLKTINADGVTIDSLSISFSFATTAA